MVNDIWCKKKYIFIGCHRLQVVFNFGDVDCGAGEINHARVKFQGDAMRGRLLAVYGCPHYIYLPNLSYIGILWQVSEWYP